MQALADAVLIVHACVVAFIVGGAVYIWIGAWLGWPGIRAPLFRYVHVGAMLFVAIETIVGLACPLTVWENALRGEQMQTGFLAHWAGRLIYYDLPGWIFNTAYVIFAGALIITLIWVPPEKADRTRFKTD